MDQKQPMRYTAFEGTQRIASGELAHVALAVKEVFDRGETAPVLIFDDTTGEQMEVDLRGSADDILKRLEEPYDATPIAVHPEREAAKGPGRPKLGVVAREVTLLPRHWDWLNEQPGGASVALRKLVEEARRTNEDRDRVRRSQEAAYRFMSVMAGNLPGFEEATRAFFAGNQPRFDEHVEPWPADVRDYARTLASAAFQGVENTQ